jgi:hypothetical protein
MFSRIRVALGIALLVSLIASITALAKGGFSFISIAGPGLKEPVRLTDPALTTDFFAFADFYQDKAKAPTDPGEGYEITRHYVDGGREIIFDRLHYYPGTGFVFYDGLENGESEYDGEWYTAQPGIKTAFEAALPIKAGSAASVEKKQPVTSAAQPDNAPAQSRPASPALLSSPAPIIALAAGLAILLVFAFWRRKVSVQ